MKLVSEYFSEVSPVRCAKVFVLDKNGYSSYEVNFWDADLDIDDWKSFGYLNHAEDAAEDFVC